jgi:hypothetical protein
MKYLPFIFLLVLVVSCQSNDTTAKEDVLAVESAQFDELRPEIIVNQSAVAASKETNEVDLTTEE